MNVLDLSNCYFMDARWGQDVPARPQGVLVCCWSGLYGDLRRRSAVRFADQELVAAAPFSGKFWWTRIIDRLSPGAQNGWREDVQSTDEVFVAIAGGAEVWVRGGPYDTREDGHYELDVAWESF